MVGRTDSRIGFPFLFAGAGSGGSCFPKDVRALVRTAREHGDELKGKHFAVWGLAFKPKTDDMREAPALVLIDSLLKAGAQVTAFDPEAIPESKRRIGDRVDYAASSMECLQGADALILVTEWSEFRHVDPADVKALLNAPVVFDGRNIMDGQRMRKAGFTYYGIGVR